MKLLSAHEACQKLGVKRQTLYAYVSRGLIRKVLQAGRTHKYDAEDVERVATRSAARRGHEAVAKGALLWGEPVLDTSISHISEGKLYYRGRDLLGLVSSQVSFEDVCALLWGPLPDDGKAKGSGFAELWTPQASPRLRSTERSFQSTSSHPTGWLRPGFWRYSFGAGPGVGASKEAPLSILCAVLKNVFARGDETLFRTLRTFLGTESTPGRPYIERDAPPLWRLISSLPFFALSDESRLVLTHEEELPRATRLLYAFASILGEEKEGASIAQLLLRDKDVALLPLLNLSLVVCADHELNASTFAARVAASCGADLYASVGAALYAFSGVKHGASCDRVEALLSSLKEGDLASWIRARISQGEGIPGFGHPLYPKGDPRAIVLLSAIDGFVERLPLLRFAEVVTQETGLLPNVDFGMVALSRVLGFPSGFATALFALGRCAGWIAHIFEQRKSNVLLRPRARYVPEEGDNPEE